MTTPRGTTPRARESGRRTSTTSRDSCISSPTTRACRRRSTAEMNEWGLCRDEFTDTGNWPYQLYVREARRMVGRIRHVAEGHPDRADEAGRHRHGLVQQRLAQRAAASDADGTATENEGDMQVKVAPYQIPYRVMLPKRAEAANLLVPVCFSATPRRLLDAPHGTAVHDSRPRRGRRGEDGDRRRRAVQDIDTAALRAPPRGRACRARRHRRQRRKRSSAVGEPRTRTRNPEPGTRTRTRNPEPGTRSGAPGAVQPLNSASTSLPSSPSSCCSPICVV